MRNGYGPSILQDVDGCFLCGRTDSKLDRHEVFPGAYRAKCKRLGLWVLLCHEGCHEGKFGVHQNPEMRNMLKRFAQNRAMSYYRWDMYDWIREFGKNYLE